MVQNDIKAVEERVKKIDGWLSRDEGRFLYKSAKNCAGRGVIVEIGSWKGKSTIWLANGAKAGGNNVPVYAIDPHTGAPEHHVIFGTKDIWTFEEFKKNIAVAGVEDAVRPIVGRSEEVAKNWEKPVEFLWIDGAHDYAAAKQDFDSWFPHLVEGGVIAYHDSTFGEVKTVVRDNIFLSKFFKKAGVVDSISFATRTDPAKQIFLDRFRNRYTFFLNNIQDLLRKIVPAGSVRQSAKIIFRQILKIVQ